jgi:hypothetical protein
MPVLKTSMFIILVIGVILLVVLYAQSITEKKNVAFECSPEFWKSHLELWKTLGVNYDDSFDKTFGKDYFDPDITLLQAINAKGVGVNHLARSGTLAYLNALVDPEIDEAKVKLAVYSGYVHDLDQLNEHCTKKG